MSKLQKVMFALVMLLPLMVISAVANAQDNSGCKTGKFVGSYTTTSSYPDIWGDGSSVVHTFVTQLNLHIDGTATEEFSGAPDIMLSGGLPTPSIGSWTCRKDGKLVVTLIFALYEPTTDAINHPTTIPYPPPVDLFLLLHQRVTHLYIVTDDNTLTRIQARHRIYLPNEDPSDPSAGTLRPLIKPQGIVYKRLVASDADLNAP